MTDKELHHLLLKACVACLEHPTMSSKDKSAIAVPIALKIGKYNKTGTFDEQQSNSQKIKQLEKQ